MERMKHSRTDEITLESQTDRLSDLPSSLVLHILSFMETKQAVQTCVLSHKWVHQWTGLQSLHFNCRSFRGLRPFKKFVLQVLSRRENSTLQRLILHTRSRERAFVSKVLQYAESHGVQETNINAYHFDQLFACKSLKTLKIRDCSMLDGITSPLVLLTSLHLYDVHFSVLTIFPNCPNLKNLVLHKCYLEGWYGDSFIAPQLEYLAMSSVTCISTYREDELVLSTPRLSVFCYTGVHIPAFSMEQCQHLQSVYICLSSPDILSYGAGRFSFYLKKFLLQVVPYIKLLTLQFPRSRCLQWMKLAPPSHMNMAGGNVFALTNFNGPNNERAPLIHEEMVMSIKHTVIEAAMFLVAEKDAVMKERSVVAGVYADIAKQLGQDLAWLHWELNQLQELRQLLCQRSLRVHGMQHRCFNCRRNHLP